jgi:hypothetical protein
MSAAVTAGGAAAGADPFAGDALETVSVCAQTPIVNTGIRTVKSKVLFRFMEVRFSPLSSFLQRLLQMVEFNRKPSIAAAVLTFCFSQVPLFLLASASRNIRQVQ